VQVGGKRLVWAGCCCAYVILATWLHCHTENWVVTYAKMGLTGKQVTPGIASPRELMMGLENGARGNPIPQTLNSKP
jgi:hypothetical protein